ncbi:hypothetical protein NA57DRAFT_35078 [Rhizodiscina lignyota]|uniref:CENP-V/GFA domain-containing protein n=1 Tax=Rhizodiscina lignyota TaxID=1504668 RepID=A0A9P4INJ5_9PEZI|nr:hypothetical protein NA57DRAFT_35078 [Rhizodiscina lignyota]
MEGHCLCGAISVKVNDSELFSGHRRGHLCHCRNCRRAAGGIFGTNLAIEASKVEITGKESLKEYMDRDTTSGTPMARCFCEHCGTPIQSVTPVMGGKVVLKLGVFERVPEPEWEAFAVRRQIWEKPLEGCIQYKLLGGPGKEQL